MSENRERGDSTPGVSGPAVGTLAPRQRPQDRTWAASYVAVAYALQHLAKRVFQLTRGCERPARFTSKKEDSQHT